MIDYQNMITDEEQLDEFSEEDFVETESDDDSIDFCA